MARGPLSPPHSTERALCPLLVCALGKAETSPTHKRRAHLSTPHFLPTCQAEIAPADILALIGGVGLSTAHLVTQDWSLNNLIACLIAGDLLQLVRRKACVRVVALRVKCCCCMW